MKKFKARLVTEQDFEASSQEEAKALAQTLTWGKGRDDTRVDVEEIVESSDLGDSGFVIVEFTGRQIVRHRRVVRMLESERRRLEEQLDSAKDDREYDRIVARVMDETSVVSRSFDDGSVRILSGGE